MRRSGVFSCYPSLKDFSLTLQARMIRSRSINKETVELVLFKFPREFWCYRSHLVPPYVIFLLKSVHIIPFSAYMPCINTHSLPFCTISLGQPPLVGAMRLTTSFSPHLSVTCAQKLFSSETGTPVKNPTLESLDRNCRQSLLPAFQAYDTSTLLIGFRKPSGSIYRFRKIGMRSMYSSSSRPL